MIIADFLNEAANHVLNWLSNDSDVKANKIFTKILEEDLNLSDAELPAISVYCFGVNDNNNGTSTIEGTAEIFVQNQDPETNDEDCKTIVAQVYNSLKKKFIPGYSNAIFMELNSIQGEALPSSLFDGYFAFGKVRFKMKVLN